MSNKNFIPTNANAFLKFATTVTDVVNQHINEWKHIPTTAFDDLLLSVNEFGQQAVITTTDSPRSQIVRRNEAQKQCESALRYFIRFYLRNPVVTNPQLAEMGIPPIDHIRTVHTEITAQVDLTFRPSFANQIVLAFKAVGAANRARPANTTGLLVAWAYGEEEPISLDDYTHTVLATKSPFHIEFDTHCSGKRVWFRACWQNARGVRVPWCDAQSIFVP